VICVEIEANEGDALLPASKLRRTRKQEGDPLLLASKREGKKRQGGMPSRQCRNQGE